MKKLFILIAAFMLIASNIYAAGTCTQVLEKNGAQATLTFTCTADAAAHTYPSTAISAANYKALRGYWIHMMTTSPGGTAPTNNTTVALNTADSPALDIFGARGLCSSTVTKVFVPVVDSVTTVFGGFTITAAPSLVMASNLVDSAVITVKITLWNN